MAAPDTDFAIDRFLQEAETLRRRIRADLLEGHRFNDLWSAYFVTDDACMRRMKVNFTTHSCLMCERLSRLFELEAEKPFLIECGLSAGCKLVVRHHPGQISAYYDPSLLVQAQQILTTAPLLGQCGYSQAESYLVCDTLTAQVLARVAFEGEVFSALPLITGFRCDRNNYLLERHAISWRKFQPKVAKQNANDILTQFCAGLLQLSNFDFVSGGLDADSLLIIDDPPSVLVDERHIKGRYTYSVGWVPGSSLEVAGIRICSPIVPEAAWGVHPKLKLWKLVLGGTTLTMYRLGSSDRANFLRHRRAGIPLYPGSLELYSLLITLMSHKGMYEFITREYKLLWSLLWISEEGSTPIDEKLQEWQEAGYLPTFDDIVDLLVGRYLRCDALELTWSYLA